jgi:hypothetical protein
MKKKLITYFAVAIIISPVLLRAQSSSSYSRYGIGDVFYSNTAASLALSQTGVSLAQQENIDIINPASWYNLNRTRFQLGISFNGLALSSNNGTGSNNFTQIDGFSLSFPISDSLGIAAAMGIVPYSKVSYKVIQNGIIPDNSGNTFQTTYQGSGGLSRTFIGASYKLPFDLAIGATLDYYFGNWNYISDADFASAGGYTSEFKKTYNPSGLGATFGIVTPDINKLFKINDVSDLRIGAVVNYISNLRTDSLFTSSSPVRTDTMGIGTSRLKIPKRISAGISMTLNKRYRVALDVSSQDWQNFSFAGTTEDDLRKALRISSGFEYRPQLEPSNSFWQLVIWRAGFSYEQTQYKINGTGINQVAISGGCSLPISYSNYIDLALQYAVRGTKHANLLLENTFSFEIEFNFGSLWFVRGPEY